MSKVIRRGFFHLLFSLISISHSSLSSVSLLFLLLFLPIFLLIPSRTARIQLFFFSRSVLRLINIRALLDHSTRNRWNIFKNFWQRIPPPPVIPVACSFQGPTTTRLALARPLFSPALESVNPPELRLPSFAQTHRQNIVDHLTRKNKKTKKKKVRRQKIFSACRETIRQREKKKHRFFHFFVVVGWDGTWTNGTE